TRVADEALLLLRMDTNVALAGLASSMAVRIGAEYRCGVHDAPPGYAWNHCHEQYVWTPVCCTTSPHHGLVWSYLGLLVQAKLRSKRFVRTFWSLRAPGGACRPARQDDSTQILVPEQPYLARKSPFARLGPSGVGAYASVRLRG